VLSEDALSWASSRAIEHLLLLEGRLRVLGLAQLEELDRRDVVAVLLPDRALAELDLVGDDEILGGRNRLAGGYCSSSSG
jgi:hypothetical protein